MAHHDLAIRDAMRWYYRIGRRVWFYEIWHFLFCEKRQRDGLTLKEFWGTSQADEAEATEGMTKRSGIHAPLDSLNLPGSANKTSALT